MHGRSSAATFLRSCASRSRRASSRYNLPRVPDTVALAALAERMKTLFGFSKALSAHKYGHYWDWGAVSCSALCLTTLSPPVQGSQMRGYVLRRGAPLLCWGQIARYSC